MNTTTKIENYIATLNLSYIPTHLHLTFSEDYHLYDSFAIIINDQQFDYRMGVGNRVASKNEEARKKFKDLKNSTFEKTRVNYLNLIKCYEKCSRSTLPSLVDVLYSLILDAESCNELFEDWCCDLGYDEDSRKALNTYTLCMKNSKKVRTFLTNTQIEKLQELFQDY